MSGSLLFLLATVSQQFDLSAALMCCVIDVFLDLWPLGLFLSKGGLGIFNSGHGIFNMCSDLSICHAQQGESGID